MLITPELESYLKKIRAALDKHIVNISDNIIRALVVKLED